MSPRSLTYLQAANAEHTGEVPVYLATITHGEDAPVRLSSDPTVRLSTDPLVYGTRHQGEEYLFVLMSIAPPEEGADAPPTASLVFENVSEDTVKLMRQMSERPLLDIREVLASAPDTVEEEWTGLIGQRFRYNDSQVALEFSVEAYELEPFGLRMSKSRFPGLFR